MWIKSWIKESEMARSSIIYHGRYAKININMLVPHKVKHNYRVSDLKRILGSPKRISTAQS